MIGEALALKGLEKRYGDVRAVDGVDLEIAAGEFVSVLGPSGSGKTTLLMMIAGFERPSGGMITIGDRDVTYAPPNRRNIGMVFQRYALFPHMTVAQNVGFPLRMRGLRQAEISHRVGEALHLVQLGDYGSRYPNELSGGQQQRVAVARALIFEPPVLLMDEPLGALDKKLRESMQFEIKKLQHRLGVTVVYVTHDQEEALTMSDRVAVMSGGELVQLGSPVSLYQKPESPFVADFIGKMNFIEGEVIGANETGHHIRLSESATLAAPGNLNGSAQLLRAGNSIRLAVRPERLRLEARGAGGDGAIPGRIETAIFVGSFRIFLVSVAGRPNDILQVQAPASEAIARFEEGDNVDLIADSDAIRLFPTAGGDAR